MSPVSIHCIPRQLLSHNSTSIGLYDFWPPLSESAGGVTLLSLSLLSIWDGCVGPVGAADGIDADTVEVASGAGVSV